MTLAPVEGLYLGHQNEAINGEVGCDYCKQGSCINPEHRLERKIRATIRALVPLGLGSVGVRAYRKGPAGPLVSVSHDDGDCTCSPFVKMEGKGQDVIGLLGLSWEAWAGVRRPLTRMGVLSARAFVALAGEQMQEYVDRRSSPSWQDVTPEHRLLRTCLALARAALY